ncbi:L,D-transpeptidase [Polyangium sorediatum]|uniref:L,D-transpeptidase n=1 Tax=Polyangium sorediatum TaxID=889274 RepID=A0ABT6NKP5_9BACT|nr:L,D-transpeptidase [Polyangium sorediatum]MDI1428890.1 L,D-transpeptidase [Polyangium sorediatum]
MKLEGRALPLVLFLASACAPSPEARYDGGSQRPRQERVVPPTDFEIEQWKEDIKLREWQEWNQRKKDGNSPFHKTEAEPPPGETPAFQFASAKSEPTSAPKAMQTEPPRIAALADQAYIYKRPAPEGLPLGYVRMGTSVTLLSNEPVEGKNCPRGYYKVAPRGYICLDPRKTTLDLNDPYYRALAELAPREDAVMPYRYAFSNGAPMYSRVPTKAEQEKAERSFGAPGTFVQLAEWSRGHEELISADERDRIRPTDPVFAIFTNGQRSVSGNGAYDPAKLVWRVIPNGSMLAYARAFEAEGRTWLVTPDLMLVPADRMRPFRRTAFHGVRLGSDVRLPLAWNRKQEPIPRYTRGENGKMVTAGQTLPPKGYVQVSERVVVGKKAYLALRNEPGAFVLADHVTVTRTAKKLPRSVKPGEKWIEVKINPGTLTAYEGDKPIYATMFSPGKGGAPIPGYDPYVHSMTKTGVFPIEWKDRVAVMSPDKEWPPKMLWISEVPNIQYLRAPLAMHVAYWHEDFGNPKSAECVNVSPEDGHFLFQWTEPALPEGWGGVRPGDGNGKATPVVITAL